MQTIRKSAGLRRGKRALTAAVFAGMLASAAMPAHAGSVSPSSYGSPGILGPALVASIMVTAVSLIACSAITGKMLGREMTHKEAIAAAMLPMACVVMKP